MVISVDLNLTYGIKSWNIMASERYKIILKQRNDARIHDSGFRVCLSTTTEYYIALEVQVYW